MNKLFDADLQFVEDTHTFINDNNVAIKLIRHNFSNTFSRRYEHEIFFRRIISFFLKRNIIKGNIIDLGAWIGDNAIPWAKNINNIVYAIDPSSQNIEFITKMCLHNDVSNIKTIQKPISDKKEIISTNNNLNHCEFTVGKRGKHILEAVSLDYLYKTKIIDNIDFIHLDVEGFELKVITGSDKIIADFHPIIAYEQHLDNEDYCGLSLYLHKKNYDIYLINEILPGCRYDCRNIIAFPKERHIDIDKIHDFVGKKVLLSLYKFVNLSCESLFTATIFGDFMSGETYTNIKSVKINNNLHLFVVHDGNFTKIIAINGNKKWIDAKYLLGKVNLADKETLLNAYYSATHTAYGTVTKNEYDIKDIVNY